ncbi:hypothetical protein [Brevibacillus centrosporus]|uniref:hypothetical protein n=1 Tax=Brevibacillus centrosporus TaxID=54910 RepID=UPI003B0106E2
MSGFHSFGHSFGAGGDASGASASLEELRSILPIYPGESVEIGDAAEIRAGQIYKSLLKIGTTKAVADIGIGAVDSIVNNPVMIPLDDKRALCFVVRYYGTAPTRYALEGFILWDNGNSVAPGAMQLIIDNANYIQNMELMELDAGKYLLAYKNTTTNKLQGTIVTVTGNAISFASTFDISTGTIPTSVGYHGCCRLAKNKVLASYGDLVRVITFDGLIATLYPEYDHMYDPSNSYIAMERKLVAISEANAVMYYKVNSSTNYPLHAKPIKVNADNTCVTIDITKSTGYSIDGYEFQAFFGNNTTLFDGNKIAFMAKSQHTDKSQGCFLFVTEVTEDGTKIATKGYLMLGSTGATNGGLFYVGKDTDGTFYFVAQFYANSNSYIGLYRVTKDFAISQDSLYTGVHFETATSLMVSCCFNRNRVMALSFAGTSKRLVASLHDTRIAMATGVITQAVPGGANAEIQQLGVVRVTKDLIPGNEYFANADGNIQTIPLHYKNQTNRLNKLGVALSPTELFIAEAIRR